MIAFPDTSFLCAIYRQQTNSATAAAYFQRMPEPLHCTALLLYEFRQSLRFQVWLNSQNPKLGFGPKECSQALRDLESDVASGAVLLVPADWAAVHQRAEDISKAHTMANGFRTMDTLHVSTALHLGATEFLTFDLRQRKLATSECLKVRP